MNWRKVLAWDTVYPEIIDYVKDLLDDIETWGEDIENHYIVNQLSNYIKPQVQQHYPELYDKEREAIDTTIKDTILKYLENNKV